MLLSLSWLREFTPYEGDAESLGDRLTMLGLELEEIQHPFDCLAGITVGHVVSCGQHPDSDHLHVCQVDVGQEALLDIVCGAPNVAQGQKVAVATIGTVLPDGTVIKKSKLRGQPSFGMICSERELNLSEDHSGIMVLPDATPVGARLIDVLPLDRDILDVAITPNRADCLSVLGLARETAMVFHLPLTIPERPCSFAAGGAAVPIAIEDPEECWLYAGRMITGLSVAPSEAAVRYRLKAVGIRPVSNIVDVTNYILMECGQPLHAFDFDSLRGGRIVVRKAKKGERLVTLDGQERAIEERDLCICDAERPVALAGVMGGLETEITEKTKTVFLESAVFRPATVRKTSRRLGLSSESSYRFERGIDQKRTVWALDRACAMLQMAGGTPYAQLNIEEPRAFVPATIPFSSEKAGRLLGVQIGDDFSRDVLEGTGCAVDFTTTPWQVTQPSWRPDITREADLIEEVGRVHGLNHIAPVMPAVSLTLDQLVGPESVFSFWMRVRHWAAGIGLHEVINYSFVGQADLDRFRVPAEDRIPIRNPLSADQNVLRTELAPGMLNAVRNNLAQGAQHIALFEVANVFRRDETSETHARESGRLGLVLTGLRHEDVWPYTPEDMDYTDMKGIVEHFLATFLGASVRPEWVPCSDHPYLLPAVRITLGEEIGVLGRLLPAVASEYLAHKDVWIAELNLDLLKKRVESVLPQCTDLAVFPPVRRDITVMGDKSLTVGSVIARIRELKHPLLEDIAFVSLFEPEGSTDKHLSFRLTFRHPNRTLKDGEVDKERNKIAQSLVASLGVRI